MFSYRFRRCGTLLLNTLPLTPQEVAADFSDFLSQYSQHYVPTPLTQDKTLFLYFILLPPHPNTPHSMRSPSPAIS